MNRGRRRRRLQRVRVISTSGSVIDPVAGEVRLRVRIPGLRWTDCEAWTLPGISKAANAKTIVKNRDKTI